MKRKYIVVIWALTASIYWNSDAFAKPLLECGGSRASDSQWFITATGETSSAFLAGSTYAEVFLTGPGQAEATWVSGMMFGQIEGLGQVRLRIDPVRASTVAIQSLDPANPAFFPAIADQTLYWLLDVWDGHGNVERTLQNIDPMKISAIINGIPPYGTPFPVTQDVLFSDVSNPGVPVAVLKSGTSAGSLNNPGGLSVNLLQYNLDPELGVFSTQWTILNTTGSPLPIHWFADGIHGMLLNGQQQQFDVLVDQALLISLQGTYDPTNPLAAIVLHANSVPGAPLAEGYSAFYVESVPEPSSMILLGSGLLVLVRTRFRRYIRRDTSSLEVPAGP